jgi:hypothetical protein
MLAADRTVCPGVGTAKATPVRQIALVHQPKKKFGSTVASDL